MHSALSFPLSHLSQYLLSAVSFILVAFGQPAWISIFSPLAAAFGYTLFWRVLLAHSSPWRRFWMSTFWFGGVQLVQLSWFVSHPYLYIYAVYILVSFGMGVQFGIIGLLVKPSRIKNALGILSIAALWIIFEWSRLFILSGLSWNPIGMALTDNLYSLQLAALFGVFGLSFWVVFTNLLALRAWIQIQEDKKYQTLIVWGIVAAIPYLFGVSHLAFQENRIAKQREEIPTFTALLVQTAFPSEESAGFTTAGLLNHVISEWRQILQVTKKFAGQTIDLIVLPEFVVPYGTYSFVYPISKVMEVFSGELGTDSLKTLPPWQLPYTVIQKGDRGPQLLADNAYWVQGLANYFQSDVLVGLEDVDQISAGKFEYYSSALLFHPREESSEEDFSLERYEKRVLVPMGEYIPFSFCRDLAARYGVFGSLTAGKEAKVMNCKHVPFSPSICYEETFGDIMREGKQKGARLFVNLTSDVWYPNSRLPKQHLDHARLRTVENGVPLIRACNTGITAAIDCFGRNISVLGDEHPEEVEWVADSLLVSFPVATYSTVYSFLGDGLIIGFSLMIILLSFCLDSNSFKKH